MRPAHWTIGQFRQSGLLNARSLVVVSILEGIVLPKKGLIPQDSIDSSEHRFASLRPRVLHVFET